jgi:D-alanine-D-alanine ligase
LPDHEQVIMTKPLIAILRGGYTGESVISMQSARTMMEAVDTQRFEALYVTVDRDRWTSERADGGPIPFDRGNFTADLGKGPKRFAAALIAIHGSPGEDGRMQGYLDMLGVPYATGGVRSMAIAMSKFSTTGLLRQMGFPVAASIVLRGRDGHTRERVLAEVGLPCFVKPDGSGSSLGISRADTPEKLDASLELAFAEDDTVMCEALVTGRELTCGVMRLQGHVQAMPVCEIRTSRPFFDYEAKYHSADTQELIPAPIPDEVTRTVQDRSVAIYKALGCDGMVRIDHFWTGQEVITIEVNTTPGFSGASIFPKMLAVAGIGVPAAINGLIEACLQRVPAR